MFIRGRKKDLIVPADGTKVLPEDVERVVEGLGGVREAAAVGVTPGDAAGEQVHVVLVLEPGIDPQAVVGPGQPRLESHQRIRGAHVWPQRGAAPHRRHRQAETHRRPRVAARRRVGRGAGGGRPGPRRGRAVRQARRHPRHDLRRTGAQLPGARRAPGGARGRLPDPHRRADVRGGARRRSAPRSGRGRRTARGHQRRRAARARRSAGVEPIGRGAAGAADCARRLPAAR